jgi:hypothetical protein
MLPERWKKFVDSGGEYVEDWHVQVSVWQLWFKKNQSWSYLNHLVILYYMWQSLTLHVNSLFMSQWGLEVQHEHRFGIFQNLESVNSILKILNKGNSLCPLQIYCGETKFSYISDSRAQMEVLYLPRYKTILLLRQPPIIVFSSWRSGYKFMNDYKRTPFHPNYFQIWIFKKIQVLCFV